jgi:sulfoxide reductase heme-binding subunit YedZ
MFGWGKMRNKMIKSKKILITILLSSILAILFSPHALAVLKDSDYDGLVDQSEIDVYKTDPNKFDTDGEGYSDGVEVIAKSNPLDPNSTPLTVSEHKKLPLIEKADPLSWYIARASGVTAFLLLTIVVLMGLVQTSKSLLKFRFMTFMTALETHRAFAWLGGIAVVIHFSSLFFDKIFHLKFMETIIPFQLSRPFKSAMGFDFNIPVALGIIAVYFIILLVLTSELRKKVFPVKVWRFIHYISFITYLLFLVHAILSGTDTKEWWMITIYATSSALVTFMFLARLFKEKLFYPKGPKNDKTSEGITQISN